jgi:hypothetical protein
MPTKTFLLALFGLLLFGGGLGGSFVAGLVVGKNQEAQVAPMILPSLQTSTDTRDNGPDFANLMQGARSGELTEDQLTTIREQFQSRSGGTGAPGQSSGRGGLGSRSPALTGTVTDVNGNVLTLNTAQGDLQVSVGEDVTINQTVEVGIENLPDGTRITVIGDPGDNGIITAITIQVIPEGVDFTEGGGWGGFRGGNWSGLSGDIHGESGDENDDSNDN